MTRASSIRAVLLSCALASAACQPAADAPGPAGGNGASTGGTGGSAGRNGGDGGSGGSAAGSGGSGGASTSSGGTGAGGSGGTGAGGSGDGNAGTGGAAGSSAAGAGGSVADAGDPAAAETGTDTSSAPPPATDRASAACGKGGAAPTEGLHTLKVGTMNRRFFLRLPASYDGKTPLPVIFGFHGAGNKDAAWFDTHTGLRRENENHAVLVFGESLFRPGSTSERSWQEEDQLPDNLAYIDATVAWLRDNVCIDNRRLFAAGQSSGAYFSQTLACHRGDVFRAAASSDGGERLFSNCKGHPGAFIRYRTGSVNGGADSKRARDFWIKHNSCKAGTTPTTTAPCVAYACADEAHLWECIDGGAHDWPAYMDRGVWNFFSQFR
jgi:polyhydroxybutyrate depolymerase